MSLQIQSKVNDKFRVQVEGQTHKEVWEQLAGAEEVFSVDTCGCCRKKNIRPIVRNVDDNNYYELRCNECGARLSYGQSKKGGKLYPRKKYHEKHPDVKSGKAKVGEWLPNQGWSKWVAEPRDDNDDDFDDEMPDVGGKKK